MNNNQNLSLELLLLNDLLTAQIIDTDIYNMALDKIMKRKNVRFTHSEQC